MSENPFKEIVVMFGQMVDATAESCGMKLNRLERYVEITKLLVRWLVEQSKNNQNQAKSPFDLVKWPEGMK